MEMIVRRGIRYRYRMFGEEFGDHLCSRNEGLSQKSSDSFNALNSCSSLDMAVMDAIIFCISATRLSFDWLVEIEDGPLLVAEAVEVAWYRGGASVVC